MGDITDSTPPAPQPGAGGEVVDPSITIAEADTWNARVEAAFSSAMEHIPADRANWVEQTYGQDRELTARVLSLVQAHERAESVFEEVVSPELQYEFLRLKPEEPGDRIGPYQLLEQLGEGGFGTVWLAEQKEPVRRRVALKILKLGMDTKEVLARFEQERQALAMMDHPNIAKVFDAGATQYGRPFIVMESVVGAKITTYCDQNRLPLSERLELFVAVCHAVQHAHQKGVIHRDIKPSNVLVSLHDGTAVPKVIDFGVAKAVQQRLSDLTVHTLLEQMIGTPPYMSPEQAEPSGLNVDTRTDIYALGVLLYELLTGRTPFDTATLVKATYDEMRQIIREREAPKPSTALQTMAGDALTDVARHRSSEPVKLTHAVRGDLDWIVMKALEKDRSRRYETANGFALDVQRHVRCEPVVARPPSRRYRFGRLVRRNRLVFAAATAVAAALITGLGVSTVLYYSERKAVGREAEQRRRADDQRQQAQASATQARESELRAKRHLYAADMNLVQQALRTNNVGSARDLLDRHRANPGELDLRGWEWRYLWQECRSSAQVQLTKRVGIPAFSASFSPDGTLLVVGYYDGRVELWDVPGRRLLKIVQSPINQRAHVAFSPKGERFASTMGVGVVKTVDPKTGNEGPLFAASGEVRDVSYSRDGEYVAVLTRNPDFVSVRRAADGSTIMDYSPPAGGGVFLNNVRISPNKDRLYVSCGAFKEPRLLCVSIPGARVLWESPIDAIEDSEVSGRTDSGFTAMDLSPDGRSLVVATGFTDPKIRVLDAESGNPVKKLAGHTGYILQVAFSKSGAVLASTSEDQTVRLWDTASWSRLKAPLRGHNHEVNAIAISGDGKTLASGNKDGEVLLWDAEIPRLANGRRALPPHIRNVIGLPLRRMVMGRSVDGKWSLIDLLSLAEERLPATEPQAAGQFPGLVPLSRRRPARQLNAASLGLNGLLNGNALSPDGKTLAVASDSGQVGLYDAATLARIDIIRSSLGAVFGVAFSPDGQRLVLGSGGESGIVIWDLSTRQMLMTLSSPDKLLYAVEFADDGNTLLAGSQQTGRNDAGSCQFWQAPSWSEIEEVERTRGLWPQTTAFRPLSQPPTLAQTKLLIEAHYREKLAEAPPQVPEQRAQWNRTIGDFAAFLGELGRSAEAESLLRKFLSDWQSQQSGDDEVFLSATNELVRLIFSRAPEERQTGGQNRVSEALRLLANASTVAPSDTILAMKLAALQIWFGKEADHAANCNRMFRWARDIEQPVIADRVAKQTNLGPTRDPEMLATALTFARRAVKLGEGNKVLMPWNRMCLGMAEYRSGNYPAADRTLSSALEALRPAREPFIEHNVGLYQAMSLFKQGRGAEAAKVFVATAAKMRPIPADERELFLERGNQDFLILWLAYKEAKQMIAPEAQKAGWELMLKDAKEVFEETRRTKGAGTKESLAASRSLAQVFDEAGRPEDALAVLTQASIDAPQDYLLANEVAALQVWLGKDEDYLKSCRRVVSYAESATADATRTQRIAAKICCLGTHGDSALMDKAVELIRRAAAAPDAPVSLSQTVLGMVEFRVGNYTAAQEALMIAEKASITEANYITGAVQLFRAMTLFEQGDQAGAGNLFAQGVAQMKALPREKRCMLPPGTNRDDLQWWVAFEEAKSLLQPAK